MNKNIQILSEPPQISMDYAGYLKLGDFWNRVRLSGPFWRFYHHDGLGAGIYSGRERIEMTPDKCYILPPYCNLRTWCTGVPFQLYIHFELSLSHGNPKIPYHVLPVTPELQNIINTLKKSLQRDKPDCLQNSLLSFALCSRSLSLLPPETLLESEMDRRLEMICNYLKEHLANDISLEMLASKVKMNPNIFSKFFREKTGATPYQYLLQLRYNQASKLLHSDQFSIDEISEMVGVKDRFHFSRTFKRIYGVPPALYRRNYSSPAYGKENMQK